MANVRVAVRARPLNRREIANGAKVVVDVNGETLNITNLKVPENQECDSRERVRQFVYDYCYSSVEPRNASQEMIFQDLGTDVLEAVFEGYNACVLAYGQSGSGKTYTMMGHPEEMGLTPRICESLFSRIDDVTEDRISVRTDISFIEIYNERVRDLLRSPLARKHRYTLRVREHPKLGPYVQDLSRHMVADFQSVQELIERGNENRSVAATQMHEHSSRSHAIFTINFTQARLDADLPSEVLSKIHLVDLAGSERASNEFNKIRLKEGANINKSLVTLGNVISALAEKSLSTWSLDSLGSSYSMSSSTGESVATSPQSSPRRSRQSFVPYRDSVLTWLLKDTLGGNSKTIMIATISPASTSYSETVSTLRYAQRAKCIVNRPMINEDPNVKLIRELRAEISRLRAILLTAQTNSSIPSALDGISITEILNQNENKAIALTNSWIEKWHESQNIVEDSEMSIRKSSSGVIVDSPLPHLVALNNDILSTGIQIYYLKEGSTVIGNDDPSSIADIVVSGSDIYGEHCQLYFDEGNVTLIPINGAMCMVNDEIVLGPIQLRQADILKLGTQNLFRFNNPIEALKLKKFREGMLLNRWNKMPLNLKESVCSFHHCIIHSTEVFHHNGVNKMILDSSHEGSTHLCGNCEHLRNDSINSVNTKLQSQYCDSCVCLFMRRLNNSKNSMASSTDSQMDCNAPNILQKQVTENCKTSALKEATFCKCNCFNGCHVHSTPVGNCSSHCNTFSKCILHSSPIKNCSNDDRIAVSGDGTDSLIRTVKQGCKCECQLGSSIQSVEEQKERNNKPEQNLSEVHQEDTEESSRNSKSSNSQPSASEPSCFHNDKTNIEDASQVFSEDNENVTKNIQNEYEENPELSTVDSYCSCASNLYQNMPNGIDYISSDNFMSCEVSSFPEPVNNGVDFSDAFPYKCELHSLHKENKYLTEEETHTYISEKQNRLLRLRRSWSTPILPSAEFLMKDSSHMSSKDVVVSKVFQSCPDLSTVGTCEFTNKNSSENVLQLHHCCFKKSSKLHSLELPENILRKQVIHKSGADFHQSCNSDQWSSCPVMAHSLFSDSAIDICEETSNISFRPLLSEWMENTGKSSDNSANNGSGLLEESEISEDNTQSSGFNSDLIVEVKNFVNVARDITDSEQLLKVFQNSLCFSNENQMATEEAVTFCSTKDIDITSKESKVSCQPKLEEDHLRKICDDDDDDDAVCSDNEIIVVVENPTTDDVEFEQENIFSENLFDESEIDFVDNKKSEEDPNIIIDLCEVHPEKQNSEVVNVTESQLNIPVPQIFYSDSLGNDDIINPSSPIVSEKVEIFIQEEELCNTDMQFGVYDGNPLHLNEYAPFGSNLLSVGESDLKRSLSNLDIQQALQNEGEIQNTVETDQSFCPPVSPAMAIKIRNNSWPEPSQHSLDQLDNEIKDLQEGIDENLFDEVLLNIGFEDAENGICEILYVNENPPGLLVTEKEQVLLQSTNVVQESGVQNKLEIDDTVCENNSYNHLLFNDENLFNHSETSSRTKISLNPTPETPEKLKCQEICSLPAIAATAVASSRVMRKLVRQRAKQRMSRDADLLSPSEECCSFSDDSLSEEKPSKFQSKKKRSKLNIAVYKDGYEESENSQSEDEEGLNHCENEEIENHLDTVVDETAFEESNKKRLRRLSNVISSSLSSLESACDNPNDNEALKSPSYDEIMEENENCEEDTSSDIVVELNDENNQIKKEKQLRKENNDNTLNIRESDEANNCISKMISFDQELTAVEEEAKTSSVPIIVLTRPSISSCCDSFEDDQTSYEKDYYDFDNIFADSILREQESHPDMVIKLKMSASEQFAEHVNINEINKSDPIDIPSNLEMIRTNQTTFDQLPEKFETENKIDSSNSFGTDDADFNSWQIDENFNDFMTCKDFDRSQLKLDVDCISSSDNVSPQSSSTTTSSSEPSHEDYYIDNSFPMLSPMDMLIDYRLISPTGRRILYTIQEMSSECSSTPSESNLACSLEESLDTVELNNLITAEKLEANTTDQLLTDYEDQAVALCDVRDPFGICPTIGSNESTKEIIDQKINTVPSVSHGTSLLSSTQDFKSRSSNESTEVFFIKTNIEVSDSSPQSQQGSNEMSSDLYVYNSFRINGESEKDMECKHRLSSGSNEEAKCSDSLRAGDDRCCSSSTSTHLSDSYLTGESNTIINSVKLKSNAVQQNVNLQDHKTVETKELMSPIERVACQDLWKLRERFSQESEEETDEDEEVEAAISQSFESQSQNSAAADNKTILNGHQLPVGNLVNNTANVELSHKEKTLNTEDITEKKDSDHINQNNVNINSELKNSLPFDCDKSNSASVINSYTNAETLFEKESSNIIHSINSSKEEIDSVNQKIKQLSNLDYLVKNEETVSRGEDRNLINLDSSDFNNDMDFSRKENSELVENIDKEEINSEHDFKLSKNLFNLAKNDASSNALKMDTTETTVNLQETNSELNLTAQIGKIVEMNNTNDEKSYIKNFGSLSDELDLISENCDIENKNSEVQEPLRMQSAAIEKTFAPLTNDGHCTPSMNPAVLHVNEDATLSKTSFDQWNISKCCANVEDVGNLNSSTDSDVNDGESFNTLELKFLIESEIPESLAEKQHISNSTSGSEVQISSDVGGKLGTLKQCDIVKQSIKAAENEQLEKSKAESTDVTEELLAINIMSSTQISDENKQNKSKTEVEMNSETILQKTETIVTEHLESDHVNYNAAESESFAKNSKLSNSDIKKMSELVMGNIDQGKLLDDKKEEIDCVVKDLVSDTITDSLGDKGLVLSNAIDKSEYINLVHDSRVSKNAPSMTVINNQLNGNCPEQSETAEVFTLNTCPLFQNVITEEKETQNTSNDVVQEETVEDFSFDDIIFTLPKTLADMNYEESVSIEEPVFSNQFSEDYFKSLWEVEEHTVREDSKNDLDRQNYTITKDSSGNVKDFIQREESITCSVAEVSLSNETKKEDSLLPFCSKNTCSPKKDDCLNEKSDNCLFSEENVFIDIGSSENTNMNSELKKFSENISTQNLIKDNDNDGDSDWISKINDAFNINLVLLDSSENSGNEKTYISDEGCSSQIEDTEILKTFSGLSINEISNEESQSFQTQISAEKYLCSNSETNIYLKENSRGMKLRTEDFYNICSSNEGTHDRTITPDSLEVLCKDEYSSKNVTNFTTWKSGQNTNHHFTVRSTPVETGYSGDRAEPCSVIVPDLWDRSWETSNDSITFVFVGPGEKLHYDSNSDLLLPANFSLHKDCSGKGKGSTNLKFCRHLHPQCSLLARSVSLENINLPQHFNMIQCNLATRASSMESMIPSDLMDVVEKGRLHDIDLDEMSGNHSSSSSFCADSINTVVKCDTELLNEVEFVKQSNINENYHDFNCRQKKSVSWSDLSGLALEQGPTSKTSRPLFLKPIIKKSENIPKSILESSSSTTPVMDNTEAFKAFESKLSTPDEDLERSALFQKIKRHNTGFFTTSKPSMSLNLPDSIKARMKRSCSEADISVENLSTFENEASDIDDSANDVGHLTLSLPTHIKARLQKDKQELGNFIETPLNEPETKSDTYPLCSEDEDDTLEVLDNLSLEAYHQDPLVNSSNKNIFTDNTNNNNNTSNNEHNLSSVQNRLSQSLGTLMNKDSILADWARLSSVMLEASNFFQHLSIYCASKISEKTTICNEKDDFSIVHFLERIRPQSEELSSLIQSKIVPEPITLKDVGIQCEAVEVLSSECSTQTPTTELFEKNRVEAGTSTDSLVSFNDKECQTSWGQVDSAIGADIEDPLNSKMTETPINFQSKDNLTTTSLFLETNPQPNISNVSKHLIDTGVHGLQTELETTKTKKNYLNCSQIFANSYKYSEADLVNKAANSKTSKEIASSNYSFTENSKPSGSNELHLIGGDIKLAIDSTAQVNTLNLQNHRLESNQNMREVCLRKEHEILTGERNHVLKLLNKYGQSPQIRKDLHCNETNECLNEDSVVKNCTDCDSQNLFYLMEYQARLQDACKRIEIKLEKLIKKRRVTEFVLQNGHSIPDSDLLQPASSFTDLSQSSLSSHFPVAKCSHSQGYASNHSLNQRLKPREYRARLVDIRRNLVAACRGSAISSQGSSNESNKSCESSPVHSNKSSESSQSKFDDLPFSVNKCLSDDETISSGNTTVNNSRKNGKFQSKQYRNFHCAGDNSPEDIRKLLKECQEARERARREIELAQEQLKHQKLAVQNLADVLRKRS